MKTRHIPEGYTLQYKDAATNTEIYYKGDNYALGYTGTSSKPFVNALFIPASSRESRIQQDLEFIRKNAESRKAHKQAKKDEFASLQVGDILYASWGYDQTNIDFYRVIARTTGTITVQQVEGKPYIDPSDQPNYEKMSGRKVAGDELIGKPTVHRSLSGKHSMDYLYKWDGRPMSYSWYA